MKGMTAVGWARARQLASGNPVSLDTVKRMSAFNRHRQNYEAARRKQRQERGNPWEYAGIVAWLGWGGDSGINWARGVSERNDAVEALTLPGQLLSQAEWDALVTPDALQTAGNEVVNDAGNELL